MGSLKVTGLVVCGLIFLFGFGPGENLWLVLFGMLGFMLCLFAPNDI